MARPKIPPAGPRHPARKILAEHTAQEIADVLGVSASSAYHMKRNLSQTQADRIVEAFATPEPASAAPPKPRRKKDHKSKFASGDHPAWFIIEKFNASDIAAKVGVTVYEIEHIADAGLRTEMADRIAAVFPDLSEERMKRVLREESLRGGGELPYAPSEPEDTLGEVPEPRPVKSWVDPSVKRRSLLEQLLQVEGAFLVVPLAGLKGGGSHD